MQQGDKAVALRVVKRDGRWRWQSRRRFTRAGLRRVVGGGGHARATVWLIHEKKLQLLAFARAQQRIVVVIIKKGIEKAGAVASPLPIAAAAIVVQDRPGGLSV